MEQTYYVTLENRRRQCMTVVVKAKSESAAIHVAEWRAREEEEDPTYQKTQCWVSLIDYEDSPSRGE